MFVVLTKSYVLKKHTRQIGNGVVSSCVGILEVRPGGRRNDQSQ